MHFNLSLRLIKNIMILCTTNVSIMFNPIPHTCVLKNITYARRKLNI